MLSAVLLLCYKIILPAATPPHGSCTTTSRKNLLLNIWMLCLNDS
jgi:hypothetical protein